MFQTIFAILKALLYFDDYRPRNDKHISLLRNKETQTTLNLISQYNLALLQIFNIQNNSSSLKFLCYSTPHPPTSPSSKSMYKEGGNTKFYCMSFLDEFNETGL